MSDTFQDFSQLFFAKKTSKYLNINILYVRCSLWQMNKRREDKEEPISKKFANFSSA